VDLDAAADELYGSSLDEFIARRTALVGEARKAGDRTLANEIGQLRKPTRTAWLVNLLARSEADRIDELLDLGRQLQEAQRSSSAANLRRLSARRRTTVDALTREAVDLGKAAGYAASEGAMQEVGQTLQAALADSEVAALLRRGRMVQAASYGGFGPMATPPTGGRPGAEAERDRSPDLLAALAASVETRGSRTSPTAATQDRASQQARQELAEAKNGWEAAGRAADEAAAEAERATARAEGLAADIDKIRGRLREAESAERDARTEARAARKRAMQLRQSAAAAEQRVTTARDALKTLDG
jgi:hypothetical protein